MQHRPRPNNIISRIKRNATRLLFICSVFNYGVETEYELREMAEVIDDLYDDYAKLLRTYRRHKSNGNDSGITDGKTR